MVAIKILSARKIVNNRIITVSKIVSPLIDKAIFPATLKHPFLLEV